ncbi:putative athila retroelement ORF1 protein [Trifolium pratense]|uniref:Putative athila retroelement ORF1 protein n=1 Tax=Trifolium pratense TaxID=57577 RepID=A0A2K3MHF2_TRIPR|nr:putative athila retroelement ORF1 protein [Trifolium pratense]
MWRRSYLLTLLLERFCTLAKESSSFLRENQFDGRAHKDPWDHQTQFSETCQIQKVPQGITEGQKKLRLFTFSLTGTAKEWIQCLPSGTIQTWKELEDKFLERFFTHNQFRDFR